MENQGFEIIRNGFKVGENGKNLMVGIKWPFFIQIIDNKCQKTVVFIKGFQAKQTCWM